MTIFDEWIANLAAIPRIKPLAKGLLSFAVPALQSVHNYGDPLGTLSATSCYSIFLRHYALLQSVGINSVPRIVAELGPGSSWGTGFAALIAGAEKYYALDLLDYSNPKLNLLIFDEIVDLFRARTPVPSSGVQSLRFPDLDNYQFPRSLAFEWDTKTESRISAIREDIASRTGIFVNTAAPWTEAAIIKPRSVDWIISESVLEHVDNLAEAYRAIAAWLRPSGFTSNLIDFDSHGLTHVWNGHWALSDAMWAALRGKRPYLLNRQPYAAHLSLAAAQGLTVRLEKRNKRFDGLLSAKFAASHRDIGDEDARTRMVFVIFQSQG